MKFWGIFFSCETKIYPDNKHEHVYIYCNEAYYSYTNVMGIICLYLGKKSAIICLTLTFEEIPHEYLGVLRDDL